MKKMEKTNVMRILDQMSITYREHTYDSTEAISGTEVASILGEDPDQVFKTLVARGDKTGPVVFCIPVCGGLNLKRAAVVSGNKRVELIMVKELLPLTGYVRGGCSPIGMKKKFPTYIDASALNFEKMTVSGGMRGCQLLMSPVDLIEFVGAKTAEDILTFDN
jgi:Cys-tRNA(Pro)/Cys-tRNA(Cys) deacylase